MIAKLIAHAETREQALAELAEACDGVEVWPVKTNAGFLTRLLSEPDFIAGHVDTGFIEARLETLTAPPEPSRFATIEAVTALAPESDGTPWTERALSGLRLGAPPAPSLIQAGERVFEARVDPEMASTAPAGAAEIVIFEGGEAFAFSRPKSASAEDGGAGDGQILAPMPGRIASVSVAAGAAVSRGQTLATLEAMKMEHALVAPFDGKVAEVRASVGDQVTEGALLVRLEPAS
jgi:acetyl/propionyl-CoA carboxylase alpha subunit